MNAYVRAGTYLGAVVFGACVGGYFAYKLLESRVRASEFAQTAAFGAYVASQRCEADADGYEQALQDFIVHLRRARAEPGRLFSEDIYDLDLMLAHARLAVLALGRESQADATTHLDEARSLCEKLHRNDCSNERMIAVVNRLDEQVPCADI